MSQDSKSPSWWHSFPGVLTAVAAVLTALTGLLVAIHQSGWLTASSPEAVAEATAPARDEGGEPVAEGGAPLPRIDRTAASLRPSMSQVRVGEATYALLDLRLEPHNPQSLALSIRLRMTNHRNFGRNFSDESFRLLVDEVPRAPVGGLNKVVEGLSADEGEVRFMVPHGAESLVLQFRDNEEIALLPLEWRRP